METALIRAGWSAYFRSIFDAARDLLHDEAFDNHDRVLAKYLTPGVLILDDLGIRHPPKRSGEFLFEIIMRRHELKSTLVTRNGRGGTFSRLIRLSLGRLLLSKACLRFAGQERLPLIRPHAMRFSKPA